MVEPPTDPTPTVEETAIAAAAYYGGRSETIRNFALALARQRVAALPCKHPVGCQSVEVKGLCLWCVQVEQDANERRTFAQRVETILLGVASLLDGLPHHTADGLSKAKRAQVEKEVDALLIEAREMGR